MATKYKELHSHSETASERPYKVCVSERRNQTGMYISKVAKALHHLHCVFIICYFVVLISLFLFLVS